MNALKLTANYIYAIFINHLRISNIYAARTSDHSEDNDYL